LNWNQTLNLYVSDPTRTLTGPHDRRPVAARMADVATVCAAVRRFEDDEWNARTD